eukprot:COSAG06_NODE_48416_length_332_cov_0.781116_1_plen_21_part_01
MLSVCLFVSLSLFLHHRLLQS